MDSTTLAGSVENILVTVQLLSRALNYSAAFRRCALPIMLCATALAQQPTSFESLLASAQQAQARSDFQSAVDFYKQALVLHPELAELQANLGLMLYQSNRDEEAIAAFRRALQLKPELFVPNLFLGLDYLRLKHFAEATTYLKHAAQLQSGNTHVLMALGNAYSGSGDNRLAIKSYSRVAEIEPDNADAWYRLGVSHMKQVEADARLLLAQHKDSGYTQALAAENFAQQGAFGEAMVSYQKALSSKDVPPDTHAAYGFVLLSRHDYPGAERELKIELNENPGSLLAKLGNAQLRVKQGAVEPGARQVAEVAKADIDFLAVHAEQMGSGLDDGQREALRQELVKLQLRGDAPEGTASILQSAVAEAPQSPGSQPDAAPVKPTKRNVGDARVLYKKGSYTHCRDALLPSLTREPADELKLLATCAFAVGDYKASYQAAQKLRALGDQETEAVYWETKSSEKLAAAALAKASQIDSASPGLQVLLGDIYRQQQRYQNAEQEYRKALTQRPGDAGAVFGLSLALLAESRKDEAFAVAQGAISSTPDDPELNAVMGEILCDRNDFAQAEPYLKKGLNTKPEYVFRVHELLGKVYANTNRDQDALVELKQALPEDKDGSIYYQIGRLYLKAGDRASAQQAFALSKRLEGEGLKRSVQKLEPGDSAAQAP